MACLTPVHIDLLPGSYTVEANKYGRHASEQVEVGSGETLTLRLILQLPERIGEDRIAAEPATPAA